MLHAKRLVGSTAALAVLYTFLGPREFDEKLVWYVLAEGVVFSSVILWSFDRLAGLRSVVAIIAAGTGNAGLILSWGILSFVPLGLSLPLGIDSPAGNILMFAWYALLGALVLWLVLRFIAGIRELRASVLGVAVLLTMLSAAPMANGFSGNLSYHKALWFLLFATALLVAYRSDRK